MANDELWTPLCDMLGIELPFVQAGMGYVARAELAAAVSEAGGLGVIGAASLSPDGLRREIHKVRALTERPFAVDILFATVGRPAVDEATTNFTRDVEAQIEIVFEEQVPVLASGLGDPAAIVPAAHDLGMKVLALVGNTKNAVRVASGGVDIVVAQGYDGGGHTGRVGTLSLLPAVIDAVEVPVMAAGGIADGRQIAAALVMGAVGVWMGTRFVASAESYGHDNYKQRIVEIDDEGTTRSRCFTGKPCRVIKNKTTEAWEDQDLQDQIQRFPRQFKVMNEWLGEDPYIAGRRQGNVAIGALAAGQSSAVIHEVLPVAKIVQRLAEETRGALADVLVGTAARAAHATVAPPG